MSPLPPAGQHQACHTPGPWSIVGLPPIRPGIVGPDGEPIADIGLNVIDEFANAYLIAAAPALLAALEEIMRVWDAYAIITQDADAKARAAIRAAKGG